MSFAKHHRIIFDLCKNLKPKVVIEIGLKHSTKILLPFFKNIGAHYHGIDPVRCPGIDSKLKNSFTYHKDYSLNILKNFDQIDIIFIDGDHTYYTVSEELKLIHAKLVPGSIIFFHDVEPPWNRKDLYYNIEMIPEKYRNSDKQGILTAIEDFLKDYKEFYSDLKIYSGFHGLGVLRRIK